MGKKQAFQSKTEITKCKKKENDYQKIVVWKFFPDK